MAVKTVTNANLADYVAEQKAKGSNIATGPEVAQVEAKLSTDGKPVTGVVGSGEERHESAPIQPKAEKPTAQVKAEKEKSDKADDKDNPFRDRIKELTDRVKDTEEFAQSEYEGRVQAQKRISELEAELKRLKPVEKPPEELKPPDPKAFTVQAEYDAAVEKYQNAIIDRRVEAKLQAAREQERQAKLQQLLEARAQEAAQDIPDFWDVVSRGPNAQVPPPYIQAVLQEWDTGVKLSYHLVKHPDEAKRIYALSPAKAVEALIPLAQQYAKPQREPAAEPAAPPPVTTRAPAPVSAIKSAGEMVPQDLNGPMPFADYRARRLADIRAKRQAGRK